MDGCVDRRRMLLETGTRRSCPARRCAPPVRVEVAHDFGITPSAERRRLKNDAAELIAASADRLERQAAEVRAADKQLALRLTKEATKLRRIARGLDIQHKQAERARRRRVTSLIADRSLTDQAEFFASADTPRSSLGEAGAS